MVLRSGIEILRELAQIEEHIRNLQEVLKDELSEEEMVNLLLLSFKIP